MKYSKEAVCVFQESEIKGYVLFREFKEQKKTGIVLRLTGVPQGEHGFHIHQSGDLREGCGSLCAHFNPYGKNHGGLKDKERHVGDLGNIEPDVNGVVNKTLYDTKIKLSGKNSIIGRSVVIHADRDDLGKGGNAESLKTGNAGKRIACGVIGLSKHSC